MGFDNECILNIQNLAGEYFCPVCRMLVYPNEALQSQCTHLYCKPCLAYIVATTRACPYDGYLVTQEDSKPLLESNKTLAETIGKISVHCLYHRSGCTWQGALSDCSLHCSTCAFGNSPVVCNRCAMQIMHRQVQEHAQRCTGVQSQALTAEGALSSAASTITNQTRATVQGATISSQNHASHTPTAVLPGQVPSQSASSNPNFPYVAQAAISATDFPHQQQLHDPYQQHYQQYYHQHYQQQLIQHPPLQPQPQYQSLPQQQPPSLVQSQPQQLVQHPPLQPQPQYQSLPQQLPPSLVQTQPQQQVQHPPLQRQPQYQSLPQQQPPSLAQTQTQQQIQHHPLQPQPQYQSLPQHQPPSLVQTQRQKQVQHPPLQPQPKYQSLPQQQPPSLVQTQQIQHPPLQPQHQYQSLPLQQPPSLVETQTQQQIQHPPSQPQQQSSSPVQTQPHAQFVPLNQHYPQTLAMSVGSQQQRQQHPTVRPQFHSHLESHMVARPPLSNEPRLHPLALQPGAFPEDNRLDLRRDVLSAASMYGHHFGVPGGSPNGRHPSMSSRTILSGRGSIPPPAEVGFRSNLLHIDDLFYKDDLELSDNLRKRKVATMGWCRICKVDCDTVEGLDLHSQTREHQRMSMDMVLMIKQQNSMRQKMTSKDFDPLSRKQSRQDYLI